MHECEWIREQINNKSMTFNQIVHCSFKVSSINATVLCISQFNWTNKILYIIQDKIPIACCSVSDLSTIESQLNAEYQTKAPQ